VAMTLMRLAHVLNEAVDGLTALDAERLEKIEEELTTATTSNSESLFAEREARSDDALRSVMATHRLLGTLLASTAVNVSVLERLRRRNDLGDTRWGR
jgi:hypothetical protein